MRLDTTLLASVSMGGEVSALRDEGLVIDTVEIPRSVQLFRDFKALIILCHYFHKNKVQIIHTHTPKAAFLGQLAGWLTRVPVRINTVHGLYFLAFDEGLKRRMFKALEKIACKRATAVLSQSQEDVDLMEREGWFKRDPSRVAYLGNGIDLTRFNPANFHANECERGPCRVGYSHRSFCYRYCRPYGCRERA